MIHRNLINVLLVVIVAGCSREAKGIAIPLTSASSSHSLGASGAYTSGSHSSFGSYSNPYKSMTKSYSPYSGALTSSMHSTIPSYSSAYTSPYSSAYTSPYSYGSMGSMGSMGMGSYGYDPMLGYETAIDMHGTGFY